MLPCVCSVIDHKRCQNVVRPSVTNSAIAFCATFLLPHFDIICDLAWKATFLANYLAVSAWILNGSSIECHEKKRKTLVFDLEARRF